LLLTLGAGCKEREVKVAPPGIGGSGYRPKPAQATPTPSVEPVAPEPTTYDFERGIPTDPGALTAPAPAPVAAVAPDAATEDAGEPRDLSDELSTALAGLTSCVDLPKAAALPDGTLTISVTASVAASGALLRIESVTAPGQPDTAKRCISQQAANLRLAPDVPGAPLRVSGSTTLRVKAATPSPAPTSGQADAGVVNRYPAPVRLNPDIAKPEPPDFAKPEPPDLAGPP
jgi:hypothetical protein